MRRLGLSYQKIEIGFSIRVEKLSFCKSAIKIREVVGTPTVHTQNVSYNKEDFFFQSFQQHLILPDIASFYRHLSVNKALTSSLFFIVKGVLKKDTFIFLFNQ